jgi:hypothetical protein
MLGIGKVPEVLGTREIEDLLLRGIAEQRPGEEAWIITPYSTMDKLGTIRRGITEACRMDVRVRFVVRDEPDQVTSAEKGLREARELGLELFAFQRLHAKLYWFENQFGIVTSANLVDGSFEASTELGLFVPCGGLHRELREWIVKVIEPGLRPVGGSKRHIASGPKVSAPSHSQNRASVQEGGHCIRCGANIPKDLDRPYCLTHFKSWAIYSNPNYEEKHCHLCGGEAKTTMVKPKCYVCFKGSTR